jgi:hypothetical protein
MLSVAAMRASNHLDNGGEGVQAKLPGNFAPPLP